MRHNRNRPMKLLRTLRGDGSLSTPTGELPVSYEISCFSQGDAIIADGALSGDLSGLEDAAEGLKLRLADGRQVVIALADADETGAEIQIPDASSL
jgi:hypothetical protein